MSVFDPTHRVLECDVERQLRALVQATDRILGHATGEQLADVADAINQVANQVRTVAIRKLGDTGPLTARCIECGRYYCADLSCTVERSDGAP